MCPFNLVCMHNLQAPPDLNSTLLVYVLTCFHVFLQSLHSLTVRWSFTVCNMLNWAPFVLHRGRTQAEQLLGPSKHQLVLCCSYVLRDGHCCCAAASQKGQTQTAADLKDLTAPSEQMWKQWSYFWICSSDSDSHWNKMKTCAEMTTFVSSCLFWFGGFYGKSKLIQVSLNQSLCWVTRFNSGYKLPGQHKNHKISLRYGSLSLPSNSEFF